MIAHSGGEQTGRPGSPGRTQTQSPPPPSKPGSPSIPGTSAGTVPSTSTTTTTTTTTTTVPPTSTSSSPGGTGTTPPVGPVTVGPSQPAGLAYTSTRGVTGYAKPGALVVAGRDNYADPAFTQVANAGGHVLVYLDPIIDNPQGRYHTMLFEASECGPVVPNWPGNPKASQWGVLSDFRVGGVLQNKLGCVLEKMATENPSISGFFADDVGSRSWFPNINWNSWSVADQQAYRDGAIAVTRTMRQVADKHRMVVIVNGTWTAGGLGPSGGGYPDAAKDGNALADGGMVEHHDGQVNFFGKYACGDQWATQSATTRGTQLMYSISMTDADRAAYAASGCFAYTSVQATYDAVPVPWGAFHSVGLPAR
ncbi:hypothetical protein TOK_0632 [Pseudonocardia sp. N23]|nr:hypothetical protein TOK_0632 [Pseudonocardia sp. N23]